MRDKQRQQQQLSKTIANRLNLLFLVVVLLFSLLLGRLAYMQLLNQDFYLEKMKASQVYTISRPNPRGQIYDAKGQALVETKLKEVVTFTRTNQQTAGKLKELAQHLATVVSLSSAQVSQRDKIDYYLADSEIYAQLVAELPSDQRYDRLGNRLPESQVYQAVVENVPQTVLDYDAAEEKIIALFSQMNATAAFDTVTLATEPLTAEQIAKIATAGQELAGFSVGMDWERTYLETSLSPLLGRISSSKTGLPAEEADSYLAKGYSLNDRVGISYLEKAYEEDLQGEKTVREITVGKDGSILTSQELSAGRQGYNLQLTADLDFQTGVEDILENYFQSELSLGHANHTQGVYAVALNPQTGAVLAMAGIEQEDGELHRNALGTMTKVFTPGSVVKGATLATGWENGVLQGNQVLTDQPIQFGSSQPINSWFTTGAMDLTAVQALEYSSNTYMVQVALKLMGQNYHPGMTLINSGYDVAMAQLRETFAQFGMGTSTGIDLPGESLGYVPETFDIGNVMTQSFGQFDNYTTLQLAQYVATVANGGQRIAPHLVAGIYESDDISQMGTLLREVEPQVLNTVPLSEEEWGLMQTGFYQVVNGGAGLTTGPEIGRGASVMISAKTGTAESYVQTEDGQSVYTSNLNVVAYAPSQAPQIAVAVVFPNSTDLRGTVSHKITRDIINLYNSLYPMY